MHPGSAENSVVKAFNFNNCSILKIFTCYFREHCPNELTNRHRFACYTCRNEPRIGPVDFVVLLTDAYLLD